MNQVTLGSQGLRVPAIGLGCMGMSDFYGPSSEAQNLRVLDRAADIGCTFWDTSDMYGPFTNELLLSKALEGRRDQITLATKFGVVRGEDGSWQGIKGSADYVTGLLRCLAEAPQDRLHRSLLSASVGPRDSDRGNGRCHGRAREGGESALHRPLRGRSGDHRPRSRGSSRQCASDRVFLVVAGRRGRDSADTSTARHRIRGLQSPRSGFLVRAQSGHEPTCNPATGGSKIRDLPTRQSPGTSGWPMRWPKSRRRSTPRQPKSRWRGFCRAMSPSPRYPGREAPNAWRKTGRHKT